MIDGAQQCRVSQQVIIGVMSMASTGTPAARGSGVVGSFRSFRVTCNRLLYQVIEVFTKSGVHLFLYTAYIY